MGLGRALGRRDVEEELVRRDRLLRRLQAKFKFKFINYTTQTISCT